MVSIFNSHTIIATYINIYIGFLRLFLFSDVAPEAIRNLSSSVSMNAMNITWIVCVCIKIILEKSTCKFNLFSFQPPPLSSRPPVMGYSVTHNTTGSMLVNKTVDNEFIVKDVDPGVYLLSLLAFNELGNGKMDTITVTGWWMYKKY